jgi:site-specific DNA-methyltransferase (adenine-specific)
MNARTIGTVNLFQGDCMHLLRALPSNAYDLAIVDPPYFAGPNKSGYYGKGYSNLGVQRAKHYDSLQYWELPSSQYFVELERVSRNQIVWGANHFANVHNFSGPGWIVWDKLNGESSFADAELAWSSFNKACRVFRYVWNGMHQGQYGGNKALNEARIHPTQKPVALYEWLLAKYGKPGDRVLDTHLGSASSAVAALNMGFSFDGVELDPAMYQAGLERVDAHHHAMQTNPSLLEQQA